jgi:hypothetical protein
VGEDASRGYHHRIVGAVAQVLRPRTRANHLLRAGLAAVAIGTTLASFIDLAREYALGVDALIPLQAATRWVNGGEPYLASAFSAGPGYALPFLYPPPVLPAVAPLLWLPGGLVVLAWLVAGMLAAGAAAARLGIPYRWIVVVLAWPPFAEAIVAGNLQTVLFLAFVLLYTRPRAASRPWAPAPQDPRTSGRPAVADGVLAAAVAALKLSQAFAWVNLVRRRPSAAFAGAAVAMAVALVTLPLVGFETWRGWVEQLGRAADPSWTLGGAGLETMLPSGGRWAILAVGLVLAFFAPADDAGASVGAVTVVFGQSLRMFGVLFLVPAMLRVRREIALVAATLIATYTLPGLWMGIALVVAAHVAAWRFPVLLEPAAGPPRQATAAVSAPAGS